MALARGSDTLEEMANGLTRGVGIGGLAVLLGLAGFACATFGLEDGDPPPHTDDPDGSSSSSSGGEASTMDVSDAQPTDAPLEPPTLRCVPYGAALPAVSALEQRTLYEPPGGESVYPFTIATDRDFVYWAEQHAGAAGSGNENAYDGKGLANILRVSRAGANVAPPTTLATAQPKTRAIVRDGTWLYWATEEPAIRRLRRVSAACAATPCTVEDVGVFPTWIIRLVRPRAGVLFALGLDGQIFRIDTSGAISVTKVGSASSFPGIAAIEDAVFFSSLLQTNVERVATDGGINPTFALVDGQDAGDGIGVDGLCTDCDTLWGIRATTHEVYRVPLGGGTMTMASAPRPFGIFDTAADERYLYLAAGDGQGFHALLKTALTSLPFTIPGSYWHIANDEQGVYLAEHTRNAASAGRVTMLVKK